MYFTLGLTQEQQTPGHGPRGQIAALLETGAYPALAKVGVEAMLGDSYDARFDYGITRLPGTVRSGLTPGRAAP